ncbi:MAG: hypothetical protein KKF65_05765 [Nanoarchaeota archaeon]|nr:hypothetical protein [Nanoarchaeota archaeon]
MAYTELVLFIRNQLNAGRDARAIRDYLIRKNIDVKSVDAAFDEVFGVQKIDSKHESAEKFIMIAIILFAFAILGVGLTLYFKSVPDVVSPVVENPSPTTEDFSSSQLKFNDTSAEDSNVLVSSDQDGICVFDDPEDKYQCYVTKFEKDEVQCWRIKDADERDFCYVAQDIYVLSV